MALSPAEVGAWAASVLAGGFTAWKFLAPVVRDMKGKGDEPSMRALVQLAADNSTLLVEDVTHLKNQQERQRGQLERIQEHADKVPTLIAEVQLARQEAQAAHAMAKRAHERIDKGEGPKARRAV